MTEIVINRKELCNAIEDVLLKGRYRGASKSKINLIDENVACLIKNQQVVLANASHTIAATVSVNCETGLETVKESQWLFFDAEKVIKYLKAMKDEVVKLNSGDGSLEIIGTSSMKMPLSIEHSGINGIAKLMTAKMDGQFATFSSTKFETMLMFEDSKDFARAIKECSVVGTAAYQLDYDNNELTISSTNFQRTETYSTKVEFTASNGEPVRIEFSAPLDKFCRGPLWLFLKEESPILFIGPDRKLIVAPYIRGE
jgi:hypothetical protein